MRLEITVPEEYVGDVIGDIRAVAGGVLGMEPGAGGTVVHVEVPMAEVLTYAPDLTSMTGGRGDYSMSFLRYEEVPPHVAQQVTERAKKELAPA